MKWNRIQVRSVPKPLVHLWVRRRNSFPASRTKHAKLASDSLSKTDVDFDPDSWNSIFELLVGEPDHYSIINVKCANNIRNKIFTLLHLARVLLGRQSPFLLPNTARHCCPFICNGYYSYAGSVQHRITKWPYKVHYPFFIVSPLTPSLSLKFNKYVI